MPHMLYSVYSVASVLQTISVSFSVFVDRNLSCSRFGHFECYIFLYTEVSRFCDKSPAVSVLFSSYRFSYSFRSRQWRSNRVCKACSARGPVAAGDPDEPYVWKREALLESLLRHWFLLTKILRLLVVGVYYSDKKFLQK